MQEGAVIGALTATNYGVILRDIIDDASFFEAGYSHLIRSDGRYLIRSNTCLLYTSCMRFGEISSMKVLMNHRVFLIYQVFNTVK